MIMLLKILQSYINITLNKLNSTVYSSDSQPGCREEVLGVPPNIEFSVFFLCFTTKGTSDSKFLACWCAAKFFKVLKGAVNLERLRTTGL